MSRKMTPSCARALINSSACAGMFGRVSGQGDQPSLPTLEDGVGIGGAVKVSGDALVQSSMVLSVLPMIRLGKELGNMCTYVA
jgi:hypothetical protein